MTNWAGVMRQDWDRRARENLFRYIYRKANHSVEDFYRQGKYHAISLTFPYLQLLKLDPAGKRVLDIGCGIGRLFPGFKELGFGEIWGIDVSQEMVERGRLLCPVDGANFALGDGESLAMLDTNYFDYCFSYNLFSCIPDVRIVLKYINEVERVLRPGGVFQLHFRRNHRLKTRVLRSLPAGLRSSVRSSYHLMSFPRSGRLSHRPMEELYAPGSLETWLGVGVTPRQVLDRISSLGLNSLYIAADPLDKSQGETYWVAGQKPDTGRMQ